MSTLFNVNYRHAYPSASEEEASFLLATESMCTSTGEFMSCPPNVSSYSHGSSSASVTEMIELIRENIHDLNASVPFEVQNWDQDMYNMGLEWVSPEFGSRL